MGGSVTLDKSVKRKLDMIIRKAYVVNFDRLVDWFDSSPFAKKEKTFITLRTFIGQPQPHTTATSCHVISFC